MILSTNELANNLYKNLKQVRNIADISVKELSEYLGLSRQTINNFESGRVVPMYSHVIAIFAVLDYRLKKNSSEWYAVQKILDTSLEKLGTDSFLAYWFRLHEINLSSSGNDNILFSLYGTLINEEPNVISITISELVSRSDKVYIFADFLIKKECLRFFDLFTKYISDKKKILPLIIFRTHLQNIIENKTYENEEHIVALYKKMNHLKEKNFIIIEESPYSRTNFKSEYDVICSMAQTRNFFVSVLTENKEILRQPTKNTNAFCMASFNNEIK